MNKLRWAIGAIVTVAVVAGVVLYDNYINPAAAKDCSSNAVIKCGVWSVNEMRSAYNKDTTKGTKNIFAGMGITSDMVNKSTVKEGTVHKNGNVVVNGQTVATNAYSAGRQSFGKSSRIKKSYGGQTYYEATTSNSFNSNSLASYVFFDANGKFLGAVIKDCGNPVRATPVPPKPQPAAQCKALDNPVVSGNNVTLTAHADVQNGAKVNAYVFTVADSKGKVVATKTVNSTAVKASTQINISTAGNYTAKVVVKTSLGDKAAAACAKNFTINPPKQKAQPAAQCKILNKPVITNRTNVSLTAEADVQNGATISSYVFTIVDANGKGVATKTVNSNAKTASTQITVDKAGNYTAKVVVKTSLGDKVADSCTQSFTIDDQPPAPQPKNPKIAIEKTVNGVKHAVVEPNQPFTYEVVVKNTSDVDIKDAVVSDPAPEGVAFKSADKGTVKDNTWTYTIPELKAGASETFKITAVVTKEITSRVKNTACVDTPTIPGKPDDCDDATVEVPKKDDMVVCVLKTKEYPKTIKKTEFNRELHSTNPEDCQEKPVTPETTDKLPETGISGGILSFLGIGALLTTSAAYALSRRNGR